MNKITFLLTLLFTVLLTTYQGSAQNFTWSTATDNGATVTETVSGVTATVSSSNNAISLADAGGLGNTSGNVVFTEFTNDNTSVTITFAPAVNIASIDAFDSQLSGGNTWTFTPTGGSNSAVATAITGTVSTVSLNWSGVTAVTVTSAAPGGLDSFGFDDVVLGSATVAPTVISSAATPLKITEATLYGDVTSNGGDAIIERGFIYSLTSVDATPTVGESSGVNVTKVVVPGTIGAFNQTISSLTDSSEYSFAAYATNNAGTTESIVQTFTTLANASNCIVINPYDTSNTNTADTHLGQSFVACETGILQSISLLVTFGETSTGETINVYSGEIVTPVNLLGSVTGQTFTENAGNPANLDVTDFSAQNITVISGEVYTFDIPTTANLVYTNDNGYTSGNLYFNGVNNADLNDLIFDVVIAESADTTAPVFENSTPNSSSVVQTGFTLGTDIDEAGTIYYVVVPDGASAPSSAEVKAGTGSGGSGQVTTGNASVNSGGFTNDFSVTSLTAATAYDVYVVAEDDEGSPNLQVSPETIDVTTASLITLTIIGLTGDDKVYDDTTAGSATGTASLSGIVGGDDVSLGGSPVFTFASANVGTGITISTTGYNISGTDSGNYILTQPTLSGDITAKELTITGLTGSDKVYDDTTAASAAGTASLSGLEVGDDVSLGGSPVFTFASANVGTGITISTTGYTISGTDSGNYILTQPTLSGDITAKELTITGLTGSDKVYDDTTAATATGTASLSGLEVGDDVSLGGSPVFTFASANVGTGITINTTGYTISGTDSGNYTLTQPTLSGDITAKELTITGLTGSDKVYDDTTAATATGTASLSGLEVGDDVSLGGSPVFTFASANVGTGITINTTGYTISGTDSGNYTLTQPTLSGDITAKELAITGLTGSDKVYDDTTAATATGTASLSGVESGDDVSLGGSPVFTFASANVGTGITINTTGYTISGTDSGNYTLTQPTLSGDITAKELTITGLTGSDKVYDDTTAASATGTASLSGLEVGDDVSLGGSPVFTFASANVGTGITINTTGYTISGTDSGNYTLTQPTLSGDITAKELTITGLTGDDKIYDGTTAATATGTASLSGLEVGDDVSLGGSPVFTFASANGGTGITINTTGYIISGTDSGNYTLTQPTLSADITGQTVSITSTEMGPTGANPIPVTITFSGAVTGFVEGDIMVGNGMTSNFSGSGAMYTVDIIPSAAGTVTVDVAANVAMDAGMTGNVAAPQFSIEYDNLLSINDEVLSNGIRLYPIPATNSITINTSTNLRIEKAEIFDIQGKMVISKVLNTASNVNTIDISSMESGVYLMTVYSENGFTTKRIIKE